MHAILRVVHQKANLQQLRLGPVTVVGRGADCQLKIASNQVSRRHCQLVVRDDGVYLEDFASSNGTFLDGVRVPSNTPTYVRAGARLAIGPARFEVEYSLAGSHVKPAGHDTESVMDAAGDTWAATPRLPPVEASEQGTEAPGPADGESLSFSEPVPQLPSAESATVPKRSFFDFLRSRPPMLAPVSDPVVAAVVLPANEAEPASSQPLSPAENPMADLPAEPNPDAVAEPDDPFQFLRQP
ncbi:MAG TPA: FHA domain-containing protein [Planctomycetaceae bacterium]|nr:FHA domain-containing protein [Planctomycetaceae bacterium]